MPLQYDKSGVTFAYPDNWKLIEGASTPEEGDETLVEVTLRSPGTAFWSLTVYPGEREPLQLIDEVLEAMLAEYPDLEHDASNASIGDQQLVGTEIRFVCLDFTNTAHVHVFHQDGNTHLLLRQAEDREWDELEPVLRAITLSLLTDLELSE